MSLQQILRPKGFSSGTFEAVNLENLLSITPPGLLAGLLLPHAAAHQSVKHQGDGTGELEGSTVVTLDVFVTSIFIIIFMNEGSKAAFLTPLHSYLPVT